MYIVHNTISVILNIYRELILRSVWRESDIHTHTQSIKIYRSDLLFSSLKTNTYIPPYIISPHLLCNHLSTFFLRFIFFRILFSFLCLPKNKHLFYDSNPTHTELVIDKSKRCFFDSCNL